MVSGVMLGFAFLGLVVGAVRFPLCKRVEANAAEPPVAQVSERHYRVGTSHAYEFRTHRGRECVLIEGGHERSGQSVAIFCD